MPYRIVLTHSDRDELAQLLKIAISNALADMKIVANQVDIVYELADDGVNQALVYLASEEGRRDRKVNKLIQEAMASSVPVFPIARKDEESSILEMLPESLSHYNTAFWEDDGVVVAMSLLRTLGLTESDRKVFISYRRSETSALANQMHTALVQRGFDVFLDRFSINPGDHFPRRIDENLADKAFLLLLESNGLQASPWVQYEIDFALENLLGLIALNLPDCESDVSSIDESDRFRLTLDNLTMQGTLTRRALAHNLVSIELAHAKSLRLRRRHLLDYLTNQLRSDGYSCQLVGDWSILASGGEENEAHLFWLTPRLPTTADFYGLYRQLQHIASEISLSLEGTVVYDLPHLPSEHQAMMNWQSIVSGIGLTQIKDISVG